MWDYPEYDLGKLFEPKKIQKNNENNENNARPFALSEETFDELCPYQPYTNDPEIRNAIKWQG